MNAIPMTATRAPRLAWYVVAAALLVVELAILSLLAVPRVDAAYSDFYIRQTTPCLLSDGLPIVYAKRTVAATSRFALTGCIIDQGWLAPRPDGITLRGPSGTLSFRLRGATAGDLRFSFVAFAVGRQPSPMISILVNGQPVGVVRLARGNGAVNSVVIPRTALDGDHLTIAVALHPDGRPLARRLNLVRWRLDPAEAPALTALGPPGYY